MAFSIVSDLSCYVVDIRPVLDGKLFRLFVRFSIFFLRIENNICITMEFLFAVCDLQFPVSQQDVALPSCA